MLASRQRTLWIGGALLLVAAVVALWLAQRSGAEATPEERCRDGDLELCFRRGLALQHGLRVKRSRPAALELFEFACEKEHYASCAAAGALWLSLRSDPNEGRRRLQQACEHGIANGCYRLAKLLLSGDVPKDEARARELLVATCGEGKAPKERYADACHDLALLPASPPEPEREVALLRAACDSEPALGRACTELGLRLLLGRGVSPDAQGARASFERACGRRHGAGCFELGRVYTEGVGVPADPVKARESFALACERGDKRACAEVHGAAGAE